MATSVTNVGFSPMAGAVASDAATAARSAVSSGRRSMTPEAGRAIEMLGHAIEYLADEFALECMDSQVRSAPGVNPRIMAIELLKARNREIYFNCPQVPTVGDRLRSLLKLQRA
jgi:hypothetical protein